MAEYRISIVVEEIDKEGNPFPDFAVSTTWGGKPPTRLTEAMRISSVLAAMKVPGT